MRTESREECTSKEVYRTAYLVGIILIWMVVIRYTGFSELACFVAIFLAVGLFPSGPLSFPHPVFWRLAFGVSLIYLGLVILALYYPYDVVRAQIVKLDPSINITVPEIEGEDCYPLTFARLRDSVLHQYGWCHIVSCVVVTMGLRHAPTMWAWTVLWEIVERVFSPMYPFMWECWWNSIFTDILICNGVGITLGVVLYRRLGLEDQHWHRNRAGNPWVAACNIGVMIFAQHAMQWSALALVDTFNIPEFHVFGAIRMGTLWIISTPGYRGYYLYATGYENTMCAQFLVCLAIYILEIAICIKFGYEKLMRMELLRLFGLFFCYVAFSVAVVFVCGFMDGNQKKSLVKHPREEHSSKQISGNPHVTSNGFVGNGSLHCNGEMRRRDIR